MEHFTQTVSDKVIWRDYPSLTDAYEQAKQPPKHKPNMEKWKDYQSREKHTGDMPTMQWYGVANLTAVKKALAEGWTEGASKLQKVSDSVTALNPPKPVSTRRRRAWADAGDTLDITRTYSGQAEAWQRCNRTQANSQRYFDLIVNLGISYSTKSDALFYRGAACLVIADLLTAAGYSVKIRAGYASRGLFINSDKYSADFVTVKDYSQPLDVNSLASIVCLAGFFRYVLFSLMTHHDQDICGSLGSTTPLDKVMEAAENTPPASIVDFDRIKTLDDATAYVKEKIEALQSDSWQQQAA